jgi:hypothetical protein
VSNFLDFFKMEAGKQLDIVRAEVDIQVCSAQCTACVWGTGLSSCVVGIQALSVVLSLLSGS